MWFVSYWWVKLVTRTMYGTDRIELRLGLYRVYQNDWSGFEVDYIHKYGEQNYKY